MQSELSSGHQQMESAAQAEEFEQALTSANDLGTKADAYTAEVAKLQQLKQEYEQASSEERREGKEGRSRWSPKQQKAKQSELSSGEKQMESAAQAEDVEPQ